MGKSKEGEIKPEKNSVDNSLELTKFAAEVQSRIRTDINSDFTLALLNEKDKEATKELTNNAYLSKRLVLSIIEEKQYVWNKAKKKWELKDIEKTTEDKIRSIANEIFDIHMIRPTMVSILNRNKKDNPILSGLMNNERKIQEQEGVDEETVAERVVNKLKGKKEEET